MNESRHVSLVVWVAAALVLLFLVLPLLVVIVLSFSNANYLQFPPATLSLRWYHSYLNSGGWVTSTILSAKVAIAAMTLSTVLGTAAAFALVRSNFPAKSLVYGILLSPIIVPSIVTAIAIYFLFARMHLINDWLGLVLAHTVVATPLVIVVVSASLRGFNIVLERAAIGLGATSWTALRRVTLPIIMPGIITGALLAFLTSFDEVVIAIFISGTDTVTLPVRMWDGLWLEITPVIAAASTVIIALTVLLFAAIDLLRRRSERISGAVISTGQV